MSSTASHGQWGVPVGYLPFTVAEAIKSVLTPTEHESLADGDLRFLAELLYDEGMEIAHVDLPRTMRICRDIFGRIKDDGIRGRMLKLVDAMDVALERGEAFDVG